MRYLPPVWSPVSLATLGRATLGTVAAPTPGIAAAALREHFSAEQAVLTDSGTSALRLAIAASLTSDRPTVALPAYGCFDLATAAMGAGARVILYDLDPATLAPDPVSFTAALGAGPAAVVVTYLNALPLPISRLAAEIRGAGALLVEDAAQGMGASMPEGRAGALGDYSVLSFGRGKGMTAGGGGALLVRNGRPQVTQPEERGGSPGIVIRMGAQWALGNPWLYGIPARLPFLGIGDTVYHPPFTPKRIPAAAEAALPAIISGHDHLADRRRAIARILGEQLKDSGVMIPAVSAGSQPGYLRFPFVAPRSLELLHTEAARRLGVGRAYPIPLDQLEPLTGSLLGQSRCAGAATLSSQLYTLPTHPSLSSREIERLGALVRQALT